ncbi:hypothetical protein DASC09_031210 [Saccharomycopsis crataegensis]|uniref:Uncharacterized protein n=1 Tax=Saccharomycopsis crataegensis TaxID=43959 RepID=A0AAV5QME0_9ASCO|nr:hypothetical protein DASC09_031210 [Saccharomycopsis crataegensis]
MVYHHTLNNFPSSSNMSLENHARSKNVSFDTIDYANGQQLKDAKDSMLREQWIRSSALKTVRRALEKCYRVSNVNQWEDCKPLADKYLEMLPEYSRVGGYLFYMKNDPSK